MDVEHRGADRIGERHQIVEAAFAARHVLGHQHRIFGREQPVGNLAERLRIGRHRHRHFVVRRLRQRHLARQRLLLQPGVVAHVDWALRFGHHRRIGARKRIRHALDTGRLVVPFHVVPELFAVDVGGVNPVDERPPPAFVHRTGGADHKDRAAVDISVVDAHGGVQHADHVVHDRHHRLSGRLGVAVRDLHRDLLVLAEQDRRLIAAVIDQRVVQAAIARPRIERDEGKVVVLDEVDDDVGLPGFFGVACLWLGWGSDVVHRGMVLVVIAGGTIGRAAPSGNAMLERQERPRPGLAEWSVDVSSGSDYIGGAGKALVPAASATHSIDRHEVP